MSQFKYSKKMHVKKIDSKDREKRRKDYKNEKWRYKYLVWMILLHQIDEGIHAFDKFQIHHKLPLSLDGDNDFDNLVLLDGDQHVKVVHNEIITPQVWDMKPGDERDILVPNFDAAYFLTKDSFDTMKIRFDSERHKKEDKNMQRLYKQIIEEKQK